jgi:putative transcriptional regulator
MTKKNISGTLRKKSRNSKMTERGTRLGRTPITSAREMLAHARDEIKMESYTLPGPLDVRAIRRKVGMSQAKFAAAFALNPRTLQEWEQGKAAPDGAVRAYLTVIERNPSAVVEALRG